MPPEVIPGKIAERFRRMPAESRTLCRLFRRDLESRTNSGCAWRGHRPRKLHREVGRARRSLAAVSSSHDTTRPGWPPTDHYQREVRRTLAEVGNDGRLEGQGIVVAAVGWARTAILRIMPELVRERAATIEPTRPLFANVSQPAGPRQASGWHRPRRSPSSSMTRSSPGLPVAWSTPRLPSPRATVVADAGDGWLAGARGIRVGETAGLPSAPRVPERRSGLGSRHCAPSEGAGDSPDATQAAARRPSAARPDVDRSGARAEPGGPAGPGDGRGQR